MTSSRKGFSFRIEKLYRCICKRLSDFGMEVSKSTIKQVQDVVVEVSSRIDSYIYHRRLPVDF